MIPATAAIWAESLDPYDVVDFTVDVTPLLDGDSIAAYSIVPLAESALLGLTVGINEYAPSILTGNILQLWLSIEASKQGAPEFDKGVSLPVEISVTTTSNPPRKRQRTMVVKVNQR